MAKLPKLGFLLVMAALAGCSTSMEARSSVTAGARIGGSPMPPGRDMGIFVDYPSSRILVMARKNAPDMRTVLAERWGDGTKGELAGAALKAKAEGEFDATSDRWVAIMKSSCGWVEAGYVTLMILHPSTTEGWSFSAAPIDPRDGFIRKGNSRL